MINPLHSMDMFEPPQLLGVSISTLPLLGFTLSTVI